MITHTYSQDAISSTGTSITIIMNHFPTQLCLFLMKIKFLMIVIKEAQKLDFCGNYV